MADAEFLLNRQSSGEERISGEQLFSRIMTGTISFTTPVRRTEESVSVPLYQHPEWKETVRRAVRNFNRIRRNYFSVSVIVPCLLPAVPVFLLWLNTSVSFFLTAVFLAFCFPLWNSFLFVWADRLIRHRFLNGAKEWRLLLLLPYVNGVAGPYLYKEMIRSLRLPKKLRIVCDILNIAMWTSWILLLVLFWILPVTAFHSLVLCVLALFCHAALLMIDLLFLPFVQKTLREKKEEMNLAGFRIRPVFRLTWNDEFLPFRRKYHRSSGRSPAKLWILLYLIFFPLLQILPVVISQEIRHGILKNQLKDAGFHCSAKEFNTASPPYASELLPQIQNVGKRTEPAMPLPFRGDLISAGYQKRMRDDLEANRENLDRFQTMKQYKSFGQCGADLLPDSGERFHLLEKLSVFQGALGIKSWEEVFQELALLEKWRSEYFPYASSCHVLLQGIAGRIRNIPEMQLKKYQHYLLRRELRETEFRKRELNWALVNLHSFAGRQNPLSLWMNNQELSNALILLPVLPLDYFRQEEWRTSYRNPMELFALYSRFIYQESGEYFAAASMRTAYFRIFRTGIALERFHRKYGRDAAALSELVPEFLSAVPLDPFDGKELRYRTGRLTERFRRIKDLPDGTFGCVIEDRNIYGIRVYSIGKDRRDDNGRDWNPGGGVMTRDQSLTIPRDIPREEISAPEN